MNDLSRTIATKRRLRVGIILLLLGLLLLTTAQVQYAQNPTPPVIALTPADATPASTATVSPFTADRFEPNDTPASATQIGLQTERDLTLIGNDMDVFTGYLKAGQTIEVATSVQDSLDTRLTLLWNNQVVAENDDRSPTDIGSLVTFTAPSDGWYIVLVEKATVYDGRYSLTVSLPTPTATPTATATPTSTSTPTVTPTSTPTATPTNTPTPSPTATALPSPTATAVPPTPTPVWPTATPLPPTATVTQIWPTVPALQPTTVPATRPAIPSPAQPATTSPVQPIAQPVITPSPASTITATATLTATATPTATLALRYLGPAAPVVTVAPTHIRLLVYYDANNDRAPGPGEGIANVSVLAVDARGQQLARVFTNAQGEAIFNLTSDSVARVIVPFVPAWSARIQPGQRNDGIVLGLPAVRLPVFLPVEPVAAEE